MKHRFLVISGALLCMAIPGTAQQDLSVQATSEPLRGTGRWKTDGVAQRSTQRWNLDLRREGDTVTGRINLSDSPLASTGNVEGKIIGSRIQGTIADDAGQLVATFDGTLSRTGMSGRYRDRTGEVGEWSWEGRLE